MKLLFREIDFKVLLVVCGLVVNFDVFDSLIHRSLNSKILEIHLWSFVCHFWSLVLSHLRITFDCGSMGRGGLILIFLVLLSFN